ncbi:hypothetical protein ABT256_07530 [Amycolatopsis japonica]|uniref:hypothetical protein n=1 Tax=Amycolatopsis japonica TaxID=208439 RepID=UPI00331CFC96
MRPVRSGRVRASVPDGRAIVDPGGLMGRGGGDQAFPVSEKRRKVMGFRLSGILRRWVRITAMLGSNSPYPAAQFACCALPAEFYLFTMSVPPDVDLQQRVAFSPCIEVDIDGLWLRDDTTE